ncbi:hypothetical protein F4777DRAFT_16193 [Nemania sp. FL0916]|nr:hypothetical protein F4777DRAFT_16193 [Nemania sp. FL0916]
MSKTKHDMLNCSVHAGRGRVQSVNKYSSCSRGGWAGLGWARLGKGAGRSCSLHATNPPVAVADARAGPPAQDQGNKEMRLTKSARAGRSPSVWQTVALLLLKHGPKVPDARHGCDVATCSSSISKKRWAGSCRGAVAAGSLQRASASEPELLCLGQAKRETAPGIESSSPAAQRSEQELLAEPQLFPPCHGYLCCRDVLEM